MDFPMLLYSFPGKCEEPDLNRADEDSDPAFSAIHRDQIK